MQVIGIGAQDDFELARDFLDRTGVATPDMLFDTSFKTWQTFGVQANSQMMVLSPDLSSGSNLIFGFDEAKRAAILDLATDLA